MKKQFATPSVTKDFILKLKLMYIVSDFNEQDNHVH